jgi:hypothetical protein
MGVMSLKQLAKHLAIDLPAGANLFTILRLMIEACITVTEEELCMIFSRRRMAMERWDYSSFLKQDGVMDLFDTYDQKGFEEELKEQEAGQTMAEEFHEEVRKLTRAVRAKADEEPKKKKQKRATKSASASSRSAPAPPSGDDLSLEDAYLYMPPDTALFKDLPNGRWLAKSKWGYSCSRSWNLYGSARAFAMTCSSAWSWVDGVCPHEWVRLAAAE